MQPILGNKLRFPTKVPSEISELKKGEICNKFRTLHNQELPNLGLHIATVLESRKLQWGGHTGHKGSRDSFRVL
jgi:hypothetical protein